MIAIILVIYGGKCKTHKTMQAEYVLGYRKDTKLGNMLQEWPFD